MQKIWFIADAHFGHTNIVKFHDRVKIQQPDGTWIKDPDADVYDHDKMLITIWNNTIAKQDIVYILGDFSFWNKQKTESILSQLNGNKHLIIGNHDSSAAKLSNYFKSTSDIKNVVFKHNTHDFLEEDFNVVMCHYPMATWKNRHYGWVNVHGHCHGSYDDVNEQSGELRVDVGLDGKLAIDNGYIVSLESLYKYFKTITKGQSLQKYVSDRIEQAKTSRF